mmetsp:Transcript_45008/g.105343  ORF Transcript_45008/g.105343 Transcript_45008/m.105343 type:complete len:331 (-) Transcript_45008:483-1475(-)
MLKRSTEAAVSSGCSGESTTRPVGPVCTWTRRTLFLRTGMPSSFLRNAAAHQSAIPSVMAPMVVSSVILSISQLLCNHDDIGMTVPAVAHPSTWHAAQSVHLASSSAALAARAQCDDLDAQPSPSSPTSPGCSPPPPRPLRPLPRPPPPSPPRAERPKSSPNLSADRAAPEPMRSAMDAPDPPEPEPTPKPDPTPVLLAPAPPLAEALAEGTPPAASAAFARLARLAASYALPSQLRLSVGASCPAPPLPAPDPASSAASASAGGCLRAMAPPRLPRASCVTSASPPPVCTSLSDTFLAESAVSPSPMNASSASASAPEIGSFSPVDAPC